MGNNASQSAATGPAIWAWPVAAGVIAIVTVALVVMRPSIGFDPVRGLLAAEQRLQHRTPAVSELSVADPADISRDRLKPISWWPPGQQMVIYGLRQTGLSIGQALKVVILACWGIGLLAWWRYFSLVAHDKRWLPWIVGGFALLRASHFTGFEYLGGETLLWAAVPVLALMHFRSIRAPVVAGIVVALLAGLLTGLLIVVKYSAAILGLGFAATWLFEAARREVSGAIWKAGAWAGGAAIGVWLAYLSVAPLLSGASPADPQTAHPWLAVITFCAAGPLVGLSDLNDIVSTWAVRRGLEFPSDGLLATASAALGALLVIWWVTVGRRNRGRADGDHDAHAWRLAVAVALATSLALAVLLVRGARISFEGRHFQYGAFLLLPFLFGRIARVYSASRGWRRALTAACGLAIFVVPVLYGAGGLAVHVSKQFGRTSALSRTGVVLDWTADGAGAEAFRTEMEGLPGFRDALLVTPTPAIALVFPERRVLLAFDGPASVSERYRGSPSGGAVFVAPPWLSESAAEFVKAQFVDVRSWARVELTSVPGAQVWRGR